MSVPAQPANTAPFAIAVLAAAADLERDELAIKQRIIERARAGDCAGVERLVTRWLSVPVAEVLLGGVSESDSSPAPPLST